MSNKYIEVLCTKPHEVAFGYDAKKNIGTWSTIKQWAEVERPESTAGLAFHFAKEAAYKINKVGTPSSKDKYATIQKALGSASGASNVAAMAPYSNKYVYYQGAITMAALRLALADDSLKKRFDALYSKGDSVKLDTSTSGIQSAAKDVYKKIAMWLEKAGHSSEDKKVKDAIRRVRGYSKLSEIEFGKRLSAEASQSVSDVFKDQKEVSKKKESAIKKQSSEARKKHGYKEATEKTPFKNKTEGNAFRAWVNDNRPKWAKDNKLDRTGGYDNSYITKAWKAFGQEYMDAMANKAFIERDIDDIAEAEAKAKEQAQAIAKSSEPSSSPAPFPDGNPFEESMDVGMMQLLQQDPAAFFKKYWYIPAGGLVGIIGLAVGVKALTK